MTVVAWVLFIVVTAAFLAFLFIVGYLFVKYMKWLWRNWKAGQDPFPDVSPLAGLFIWRSTSKGAWGDIWRRRGGH